MLSSIEIVELGARAVVELQRENIEELWRRLYPDTPDERFSEILPRHASRRGFRFLAAYDEAEKLAGFAYGYLGGPGEWWHDHVASALGPKGAERWLPPGHFEFVELQVRPELQGQGLGARLHDELLDGIDAPTTVLSTTKDNERALGFYRRRGWQVIVDELSFGSGYEPFTVLGKDLRGAGHSRRRWNRMRRCSARS
jgi:ribosomal protein S18 acetylase RimI-like enzyme